MSEQTKFKMIEINIPATCCVCGKTSDTEKKFWRLTEKEFKIQKLANVQSKYLGKFLCDPGGLCWSVIQK